MVSPRQIHDDLKKTKNCCRVISSRKVIERPLFFFPPAGSLLEQLPRPSFRTGVAEPGARGHGPPKMSGGAKVCFAPPPQILTTGSSKMGAGGQNLCQIASEHPEMCKILPAAGS